MIIFCPSHKKAAKQSNRYLSLIIIILIESSPGKMKNLNWKIMHLTNENIFNDRLDWHRGIPPPLPLHVRMAIMGKMKCSNPQGYPYWLGLLPPRWYYRDSTPTKARSQCVSKWQRWELRVLTILPALWSGCCGSSSIYRRYLITLPNGRVPTRLVGRVK